jgi:hypothetical protein
MRTGFVLMLAAPLVLWGCKDDEARGSPRFTYLPVSWAPEVMVSGCDGYGLGTVRVDNDLDFAETCLPVRLGCSDTRTAGCGEGRFAASFTHTTEPGHPNGGDDRAALQEK